MDRHIKILGILTLIFHGLLIPALLVIVIVFWGASVLADDPTASGVIGGVGIIIAVILLVLMLPGIIGGIGLLTRKSWARIPVMIANAINIFSFPVGTALGIYTFWVLTKEESIDLLDG